jgi:hypothetical protein
MVGGSRCVGLVWRVVIFGEGRGGRCGVAVREARVDGWMDGWMEGLGWEVWSLCDECGNLGKD